MKFYLLILINSLFIFGCENRTTKSFHGKINKKCVTIVNKQRRVLHKTKYIDPLDNETLWVYKEEILPVSKRRLPYLIQVTSGEIYESAIIYTDEVKIVILTRDGKQIKLYNDMIWQRNINPEYKYND